MTSACRRWYPEAGQVIYEMHVRGFSKRCADIAQPLRGTYRRARQSRRCSTICAALGVGAVEFMPASAWLDERHLPPLGLTNYWGYNPVCYMAPDPRLAPGGFAEIRATTDAWRASGIAAILDVVFNHTGEGDMMGPTVSLRGLDHRSYYRLDPRDPSVMINVTGCGNTLAADHPMVLRLIMDSLRLWARRAGLSGFRFDLASTIARNPYDYDAARALPSGGLAGPRSARPRDDRRALGYRHGRLSGRAFPAALDRVERPLPATPCGASGAAMPA